MKIQLDLNPMSKLPLYDTNFGRNIYIYTNDSVYLYTFYGEDKVILNGGYLYTWEKIKHKAIGWTYNDIELEIKKDTEVKEEK